MSLAEADLLADVQQRFFSPLISAAPRAIGVELELIPVIEFTRKPALTPATTAVLSSLARTRAWTEKRNGSDPPSWELNDGARISFEPGGQLEISSQPHPTPITLIDATRDLVNLLRDAMEREGIELVAAGVDPYNDIGAVPLQLHRPRYTGMTHYFDSIGPSGIRMMRQTAALQINVERGEDPQSRWLLLNAITPVVTALFSNSPDYAGKKTNHASYRAHLWRTLDDSRTGLPCDEDDPVRRYVDFALDAYAMRSGNSQYPYRTFRELMHDEAIGMEDWEFHLSTLFPDVRPKQYFELRSADTIEPRWLAAPVLFVTSIVYDPHSAQRAFEIVGTPNVDLLELAGIKGLAHPALRRMARALADIALDGAESLGTQYLSRENVKTAAEYFDQVIPAF